jgi:DNA-binding CsgD family transcriptional regulator
MPNKKRPITTVFSPQEARVAVLYGSGFRVGQIAWALSISLQAARSSIKDAQYKYYRRTGRQLSIVEAMREVERGNITWPLKHKNG